MISGDILRGYNDIIVLGLLSEKDSYGYNLLQEITARSGHSYQMKETTLYSVLSRLEKTAWSVPMKAARRWAASAPISISPGTASGTFRKNAKSGLKPGN